MFSKWFLRISHGIFNLIVIFVLLLFAVYACYALWDNNQVLHAAEDVQQELMRLKPTISPSPNVEGQAEEPDGGFSELLEINADVIGWLSMDETRIDFPVVQGQDNLEYINMDVYGNFSLAGSIYLDTRNQKDFADAYSLLYGHHMAEGNMFGDLDLYKEESFFRSNTTGTLILPEKAYKLEVLSCMLVGSSDDLIFDPDYTRDHIDELLEYAQQESLYLHSETLERFLRSSDQKILALSTCSSEFTDARTVVLVWMQSFTELTQ